MATTIPPKKTTKAEGLVKSRSSILVILAWEGEAQKLHIRGVNRGDLPAVDNMVELMPMAYICDYCARGVQYGETGKHHRGVAGAQWKKRAHSTRKVFKPNLHVARVMVGNDKVKVKLCTKCLRMFKNAEVQSSSVVATA